MKAVLDYYIVTGQQKNIMNKNEDGLTGHVGVRVRIRVRVRARARVRVMNLPGALWLGGSGSC